MRIHGEAPTQRPLVSAALMHVIKIEVRRKRGYVNVDFVTILSTSLAIRKL